MESISGDEPKTYMDIFWVKKFGYESPRTTLGFLEKDPTFGKQAAQDSKQIGMEETSLHRRLGSLWEKVLVRVAYSTFPKKLY